MTEREQNIIITRREKGDSIASIAKDLGLNVNTVKSFCRRQKINLNKTNEEACLQCGARLPGYENGRPRRFCSDKCRQAYWNAHPKRYQTDHLCPACGQVFKARRSRKYCSHPCYIKDRFGDSR
jgi:predicted RNA-binding Zn-ribbon protein involved in translation (DUF1610 family)